MPTFDDRDGDEHLRARNQRTGLILGAVALAGFLGVMLRYWLL